MAGIHLRLPAAAMLLMGCMTATGLGGIPVPQQGTPQPSVGGEYKANLLYTPPDPSATGGMHLKSSLPLVFACAVPESNQEHVYKGTLSADGKDVTFSGLPVARYDVMLVTADHYYEGFSLNRDEDSLASSDKDSIEEIFSRSVPFFDQKETEIVKGTPGDNGRAAALVQWMRVGGNLLNQNGNLMAGHQIRTVRLAFLADVGPGWEVTATRELMRTDVFPDMRHGFLPVSQVDSLNGIRVVDSVKDVGLVDLSAGVPLRKAPAGQ